MFRAFFTVGGFTLMSRVLGFVRDKLIANLLGAGHLADVWIAAFRLPNLFRRIFGEGAFNSAFVPMYSRKIEEEGEAAADEFGSRVLTLILAMLIGCFVLTFIFMEPVIRVIAAGFEGNKFDLAVSASRITLGYLIFVCLMAVFSGVLNSRRVFGAPAFAYVLLNIVFVGGIFFFLREAFGIGEISQVIKEADENDKGGRFVEFSARQIESVKTLGWCVLAAGVLQLGLVVISAFRNGVRFRFRFPKIDSEMKKLGLLMLPGLASAGVQQINVLVGQSVASQAEGGNAAMFYSDRINQLPLGLIGIAAGIVLLPQIARSLRRGDTQEAKSDIAKGIEMSLLFSLPAMVACLVIPREIIFAIFEGGRFEASAATVAGFALAAYAIGTPAYIVARVLQSGFFARENTRTPMIFTIISAVVNIILCFPFFAWMGPAGCALATSIAGLVNVALLWTGLRRDQLLKLANGFTTRILRMLISAALMGGVIWAAAYFSRPWLMAPGSFFQRLPILIVIVGLGVVAYFAFVFLTRVYSVAEVKAMFRRRRSKNSEEL